MTELPPNEPASKADSPDAERLRRQAEALRQAGPVVASDSPHYPSWQRFTILSFIIAALAVSLLLVVFNGVRRQLLSSLGQEWVRLYQSDRQAGIHKLPAPPPRPVETRVVGATPVIIAASNEPLPGPGEVGQTETKRTFVPPSRSPQFEGAFRVLTVQSAAAAALAGGQMEGLQFQRWRPLQARPPVYFVDLIATDSGGTEGHYVWSVNLEDNQVTPQSQLARDLEANR